MIEIIQQPLHFKSYNEALRSTMDRRADQYEADRKGIGGIVQEKIEKVNSRFGTDFAPRIGGPTRSEMSGQELQQHAPNFSKK